MNGESKSKSGVTFGSFIKQYTMLIALVIVYILFTALTGGRMLNAQNVSNLLLQNSYVLVLACGMLLCILTGGNVDLSIGSTVCLVGAVAAVMLTSTGINDIIVILICLAVGLVIGIWQGWLVGYVHIPPFICTLAGMFLWRGLGRAVLQSKTINVTGSKLFVNIFASYIQLPGGAKNGVYWYAFGAGIVIAICLLVWTTISRRRKKKKGYTVPPAFGNYMKWCLFDAVIIYYSWKLAHYKGVPVMLIWVLGIVFLYGFITSKTAFGRYFYAVGGNEKATKLSGINTKRVYFMAYASMSLLAGLAGLLMAARVGSVNGDTGTSYEMDAIGSCFIGGASAYGGSGTISGIVIGALLLGVINQGMSIIGLDNNWQYVVKGAVLLAAVVFDVVSNHKTGKS